MYQELEKLLIIKLKKILHSNLIYISLLVISFLAILIGITLKKESIYDISQDTFEMVLKDIKVNDNKIILELVGEENLIGFYYINNQDTLKKVIGELDYGIRVRLHGELMIPSNNTIPNTFNYKKYLNNKGIFYLLKIDKIEIMDDKVNFIYDVKNFISDRIIKIDRSGYMKAFILGDKSQIDKDVYERYQKIGITHLFALSGMHIGLFSGLILKVLKKVNNKCKYLVINIILIFYGYIVNFPSSIKRCLVFFILNSFNKCFKMELSSLKIFLLTITLLIISDYKIVFDIGFIYSFLTVFGIIYLNDYISDNNYFRSAFKLSLIAFLFSLPVSLSNFYEINLLSIFYNMIYVPFVSLIFYPISLLCFIFPFFSNILTIIIRIMEWSSGLLVNIDLFVFCLNFNFIECILFYLCLILIFKYKQYIFTVCLLLIVIIDVLIPYFDSSGYIYYFSVGQGDSSLIISPFRRSAVLIDTGGRKSFNNRDTNLVSDNILTFLKSKGIKKIDYMILTHGDYDHMGEAGNFIDNLKVKEIFFNRGEYNILENDLIKKLKSKRISKFKSGNLLRMGTDKLYFLNTQVYDNENDNSNVIYMKINGIKLLFMGDAGFKKENDVLEKYDIKDVDFIKIGHHGADTSSSESFINKINPKNAIISVGKNNKYGHPKEKVLDILNEVSVYRTDKDGSVQVKISKNSYAIKTYSP